MTLIYPSQASQIAATHVERLNLPVTGQRKNAFPVCLCLRRIARINDAAKTAIRVYNQVLAALIVSSFSTYGTARCSFRGVGPNLFELGNVETHLRVTPKKPRTDLPSRLTECDFVTRKSSSISPSSES